MANIDFPANPVTGTQYIFAGITYVFTAQGVWSPAAGGSTSTLSVPQGRLTLAPLAPVMLADTTGTAIVYAPFNGNRVPIYNGTSFTGQPMSGPITTDLGDTQYSSTSLVADRVYDWFIWRDGAAVPPRLRLSHGPAWTSKTTRLDQLTRVEGLLVNMTAFAGSLGGPAAERGTYVGTTYCETANTLKWQVGASGKKGQYHVWNAYNRVNIGATVNDMTASWDASGVNWRISNSADTNITRAPRVEAVFGLQEDSVDVMLVQECFITSGYGYAGIGLDWTSGYPSAPAVVPWGKEILVAHHIAVPVIGFHYWVALEYGVGATGLTFFGSSTPSGGQWSAGMNFNARM